ncbi:hypothetical protein [Agreia sp. Leaf283]|uniref:hypothetical protein n=1 Tax=Agreia sp. Leaf283 TaxID=1736321 RepID=UPI0006F60B71|nr:hypothetical protein [Agreia sp. Leaf283]KQP54758.1 hypothetical protein ASF51_15900 [Agreia sp. Leaf283]
MSSDDDRWSPVDVVIFTLASLALVGVITGSVLVMTAKRSSAYLAPLEVGAYPGSVTALVCAAVVLLGAVLLRHPAAIGCMALFSGLLFALPAYASFITTRRASSAVETPSGDVYTAQSFYLVASGLVLIATLAGIVKYHVLKRRHLRATTPRRPPPRRKRLGARKSQPKRRPGTRS